MRYHNLYPSKCPVHSKRRVRRTCRACNAAYMRDYMGWRSLKAPWRAGWGSLHSLAPNHLCGPSSLLRPALVVPPVCPALGIPLAASGSGSPNSPSLCRMILSLGYIPGNVRVVSHCANQIRGDWELPKLRLYARAGPKAFRPVYSKLADYLEQQTLLFEVRAKAAGGGRAGEEWQKIERFLERAFENQKSGCVRP